jgi:hypothetical protein
MSYPNTPAPPPGYPSSPGYGQPPATGPLRGRTPRRLGWIFLVVAIALFVVGGVVLGTKSLGKVNGFQRVSVASGGGAVQLSGTGKWVVYYEADNVSSSISRLPGIRVVVTDPSGHPVPLQLYGNSSDGKIKKLPYDFNGHKGVAAFQFTANVPGRYSIQVQAVDNLPPGADIAIGRDISGGTVAGALLIVGGVLFLIAAIVLLIVGYVKRSRHKRELREAAAYGGVAPGFGAPPPPGYAAPPPGYGAPPQGYGAGPPPGHGNQPPEYGNQPPGYGNQPPGYGNQPPGYGNQPPRYGNQPPGYGNQPPPSGPEPS